MAQALEGVKVADFSWAVMGPLIAKYLADHGATVVKVESSTRVDVMRTVVFYAQNIAGVNRNPVQASYNSNKYDVTLNLKNTRGLEVAKRLIAWSDVVIENFAPGTMERWGLSYRDLSKVKPDIIMMSGSLEGQTGPHAKGAGVGITFQALAGFTNLVGWPDRPPAGMPNAYTDFVAPWYGVAAIVGALDYRRRTGKGLYIDLSQLETGVSFLSPTILDYTTNGRVQGRMGNGCSYAAPHAVYRCRGDERWCAISVFSDEEWEAFSRVIGNPAWTKTPKFATLLGRRQNEEELNRLVEQWTINHFAEEVMEVMQKAGVAAGVAETGEDLHKDPQLKHRHHFWMLKHPEMGITSYDGPSYRLSKTPVELRMHGPCVGEHNDYVFTEMLGMSDEEFLELLSEGVFE
jgi:benzylsuccinate CoA-transferase BbsF subunit